MVIRVLTAMLTLVLVLMGCAAPPPAEEMAATAPAPGTKQDGYPASGDYRIGPQDLLEIQVFGVEELSRTVRVNSRGMISLPLIGRMQAAGRTSQELEAGIAARLAEDYLQDPQVSVFIEEYTSQRVTVEGAVKKPGIYPVKGRTTLLQSIALAEGLGEFANPDDVTLFRSQPSGQRVAMQFSLNDIRGGNAVDPPIQNDDIVVVQRSQAKAFVKGVTNTLRGFVRPFILF